MKHLLDTGMPEVERTAFKLQIEEKYNWQKIAEQTVKVYEQTIKTGQSLQIRICFGPYVFWALYQRKTFLG